MQTPSFSLLCAFAIALSCNALASSPTWSSSVARIVYSKCGTCHVDGGIAPFSLASYEDVTSKAESVQFAVGRKTMPPWPPNDTERRLAHSRALSSEDLTALEAWFASGMPRGDQASEPTPPRSLRTTQLPAAPELSVRIPTYTSTATNRDVYQYFVLPTSFLTDRYVRAFEVMPGNPEIVHHALIFVDTTGTARARDAATPEPGFGGFGGDGGDLIAAWAPGSPPVVLPQNFGLRLPAGADLVIQIHYPAGTAGRVDSTRLNMLFAPVGPVRQVFISPILNHSAPSLITRPFVLPANSVTTMRNSYTIPFGMYTLLSVAPHMHLIGKSIKAIAVSPERDTTTLIDITNWDFHWQGGYLYKRPIVVRSGTNLYGTAVYDNTANNHHNPSNPPREVRLGESTTDEMFLVYFMYTAYQRGDEALDLESLTTPTSVAEFTAPSSSFHVYPLPASSTLTVVGKGALVELVDMFGRSVASTHVDSGTATLNVQDIPVGFYMAICGGERQRVIISR